MRMKGVHLGALVGMVIGATLFGWSDADAVLCVKTKRGVIAKVTIRGDACMKKESVGDPSVLLGLATTTTSPTTTTTLSPSAKKAPRIVDSAGNEVGWVIGAPPNFDVTQPVWALRTIDDQKVIFPMLRNRPFPLIGQDFAVDDFEHEFVHAGTECEGDRFSLVPDLHAVLMGDLTKRVYPSTDGKSGFLSTFEVTKLNGFMSQENFQFQCATPPEPVPPTVDCPTGNPVGSAFPCDPNKLEPGGDPTTQCTCIRCCVTSSVPTIDLWRVRTIDLGLGNSTPPFKIKIDP